MSSKKSQNLKVGTLRKACNSCRRLKMGCAPCVPPNPDGCARCVKNARECMVNDVPWADFKPSDSTFHPPIENIVKTQVSTPQENLPVTHVATMPVTMPMATPMTVQQSGIQSMIMSYPGYPSYAYFTPFQPYYAQQYYNYPGATPNNTSPQPSPVPITTLPATPDDKLVPFDDGIPKIIEIIEKGANLSDYWQFQQDLQQAWLGLGLPLETIHWIIGDVFLNCHHYPCGVVPRDWYVDVASDTPTPPHPQVGQSLWLKRPLLAASMLVCCFNPRTGTLGHNTLVTVNVDALNRLAERVFQNSVYLLTLSCKKDLDVPLELYLESWMANVIHRLTYGHFRCIKGHLVSLNVQAFAIQTWNLNHMDQDSHSNRYLEELAEPRQTLLRQCVRRLIVDHGFMQNLVSTVTGFRPGFHFRDCIKMRPCVPDPIFLRLNQNWQERSWDDYYGIMDYTWLLLPKGHQQREYGLRVAMDFFSTGSAFLQGVTNSIFNMVCHIMGKPREYPFFPLNHPNMKPDFVNELIQDCFNHLPHAILTAMSEGIQPALWDYLVASLGATQSARCLLYLMRLMEAQLNLMTSTSVGSPTHFCIVIDKSTEEACKLVGLQPTKVDREDFDPNAPWLLVSQEYTEEDVVTVCIRVSLLARFLNNLQQTDNRIRIGYTALALSVRSAIILLSAVNAMVHRGVSNNVLRSTMEDTRGIITFLTNTNRGGIGLAHNLYAWAAPLSKSLMNMLEGGVTPTRGVVHQLWEKLFFE